jgi:pyrroline-5-carboxylate reductase
MIRKNLAVIGVGNMAKAIISGVCNADIDIGKIYLYDVNEAQYASLSNENIVGASDMYDAVVNSDIVLLSVKPQNFTEVLNTIKSITEYEKKLYITIGAGISTAYIKNILGDVAVIRALPNLPMVIGMGVSAICKSNSNSSDDTELVERIFSSVGAVVQIDEDQMNSIIGVTSSSPAYVFKFIAAICDGAHAQGLEFDGMLEAVCDMVIGSAQLLKSGDLSPDELISRVCSKGGTTERAIATLNDAGFDSMITDAMIACTKRADELGS